MPLVVAHKAHAVLTATQSGALAHGTPEKETRMTRRSKLTLLGMVAALTMLAAFVPRASARAFSFDDNNFRAAWNSIEFASESITSIRCPLTLEGTFVSRTVAKRVGAVIGRVIRADVRGGLAAGECTNGSVRANTETLPWDIAYDSFAGTLPNITSVRLSLVGASFEADSLDFLIPKCRSTMTITEPGGGSVSVIREVGGVLRFERYRADETRRIVCRDPFEFNIRGAFSGEAAMTRRGSTTRIAVSLI
ncbi:MAG: hypothetical protein ACJ768_04200 [Gaiellaceae bacterium]